MLSARLTLPSNVRCVISDGGFNIPSKVLSLKLKSMRIPRFPFMPVVALYARLLGGFSLFAKGVEHSAAASSLPFLLLYGSDDRTVPLYMGKSIADACGQRGMLLVFEGARHLDCADREPERYLSAVLRFLEKNMSV